MARPVVALLTDFGTRDHYVGAMKGVVLGICPAAALVDITHEVPAYDVLAGALELAAAYRYFPAATVFLVVVDPGVGSNRRGVAVDAGQYRFVGPDNGVFGLVCGEHPPARIVELTEGRYARPTISRTFEGRDRFAPAAAWLAQGVEMAALGRPAGSLHPLQVPQPVLGGGAIHGEVLRVDRFGNLITNIDRRAVEALGTGDLEIRIGGRQVPRLVSTYTEAPPGELCALFGSTDHLEIAASGASAAALLALGRGAAVRLAQRA
jgi:S-adenosylmethionine hydrolase